MKAISLILLGFLLSCASDDTRPKYVSVDLPDDSPITQTVMKKRPELTGCYMESDAYTLRKQGGRLIVEFTVTSAGVVDNERIFLTTLQDPNFEACVLNVIRTTNFAPQEDAIHVKQPFNFHPENV